MEKLSTLDLLPLFFIFMGIMLMIFRIVKHVKDRDTSNVSITISIFFGCMFALFICTRANSMKIFSPYSSYDEGYKLGLGEYPKTCDYFFCRIHNQKVWGKRE